MGDFLKKAYDKIKPKKRQWKVYVVIEDKIKEERLIAIFTNKNKAECYIDDTTATGNYKIIELKGNIK